MKYKNLFIKYGLSFIISFTIIKILQSINQYNFVSFISGIIIEGIFINIYDRIDYEEE